MKDVVDCVLLDGCGDVFVVDDDICVADIFLEWMNG